MNTYDFKRLCEEYILENCRKILKNDYKNVGEFDFWAAYEDYMGVIRDCLDDSVANVCYHENKTVPLICPLPDFNEEETSAFPCTTVVYNYILKEVVKYHSCDHNWRHNNQGICAFRLNESIEDTSAAHYVPSSGMIEFKGYYVEDGEVSIHELMHYLDYEFGLFVSNHDFRYEHNYLDSDYSKTNAKEWMSEAYPHWTLRDKIWIESHPGTCKWFKENNLPQLPVSMIVALTENNYFDSITRRWETESYENFRKRHDNQISKIID